MSTIRHDTTGLPDAATLRRSILAKFDWLKRARTDALKTHWNELFRRIKPAAIAPSLGRVTLGQDVVGEVLELYRRALFEETT